MKIVVIGGSGLIGSKLVAKLREGGHEAVPASPNTGVNTLTGEGLAEALKGAAVVVDVSNSPSWSDADVMNFFETSTRNLLTHEAATGVKHHVALSVVGTERLLASGYFRAKITQENMIKNSSIPYSLVRATQFFEFMKGISDISTQGNTVRLPTAFIQPMAADDVASAVARVAIGAPVLWRIPNQYFVVSTAIDRGIPLMQGPNTEIARSITGLARMLTKDDLEVKRSAWSLFKTV